MIPILFAENSTTFTTNGIGRLSDAISCVVLEERNGQYELTMTYPVTGVHSEDITLRSIIVAKPSQGGNIQPFRVYKISKPINGKYTINAQHLSYDLNKNVCMPFSVTASSSACSQALAGVKNNAVEACPFTFTTDVVTAASYTQKSPASIRSRLGGTEGSILDQFHGEYEWDVYNVTLHRNRGTTKNIPLRYGKNITDIKQEEEISNTITGIVPYWMDNDGNNLVTLPEKAVYAPNASAYPQKLTVPMDFSADYENQPTEAQLRTHAQAYVNQSGIGVPKVSIDVSFVNLADTEEYKDLIALQNVNLCDTIPVEFEPLGISTTAKIVKTEYDCLSEKYIKLTVGSLRSNLATAITDQNNAIVTETSAKFSKVTDQIDNATAWLTSSGGYVVAVKNQDGSWKELLFLDTNDTATATNVLRINENGIGFSSNGVSGPYTQAWTLDGRLVIGGTNVPSITVYDSNNQIIFQASADAMIWNAANSSMSNTGVITAEGANLTDCNITDGSITMIGSNSWLKIYDGEIHGGRGTTVGQNETYIAFDHIHNNQTGNILLHGTNLVIQTDGIAVMNGKNQSSGTTAHSGDYVTDITYEQHTFVTNITEQTDYISNVCTNLTDHGGGSLSWNNESFSYMYGIQYDYVTMDVATGHTYRQMINGIGT